MNIHKDFKELLQLLENNQVAYMVVGGYAVAFHGYPRFTKDLDIFYSNTHDNVDRILKALVQFGFSKEQVPLDDFFTSGTVITFGVAPVRIDFINQIDGVRFDDAYPESVRGRYDDVQITFISKSQLIKNKTSTDRTQDKADAENLS